MIEHGHATHTGLQRAHNEDSYWADTERGLWLVADGMGGPRRGEAASATALDTTVTAIQAGIALPDAFRRAGAAVLAHPGQHSAATPMGSTLAALRISNGSFEAARIGDSRIYLWQDGKLARLPHAKIDADSTAEDGPSLPSCKRATQALGITPTLALDAHPVSGACVPGMQFLLCSDGLTEELDDARIGAIVSRTDLAAQECVDH
ncbi:MAG TPA: PP2C family serine/threonine-protein phosphatase, partial [Rhodanobacteraceae bacterium]|nr:PP2C family serine/threonine-protein phosphatase [Rhodanobacteraceae bacterium]